MRKQKGSEPAAPSVQAIEAFITEQHEGLTKREKAALVSLKGQRAGGSTATSAEVAKLATADADALIAELAKDGAK